ncbi:MAG: metallophosphoesterase [Pseudomonadota bacterium]
MSAPQIGSLLLYGAAGLCVFLVVLNRFLILLPMGRAKLPVILAAFLAMCGSAAIAGLWLHRFPWLLAPATVLCFILAGEARQAFLRRSCAGSKPIESIPHTTPGLSNPITTTDLVTRRFEVHHPKWGGQPLRIVHLTDLHADSGVPAEYYRRVLETAEQIEPDLAVFTGDFVTNIDCVPALREVLRPIAGIENYAVLGNHDYWANREMIGNVVKDRGLRLLTNESVTVRVRGREVTVSGYDYPWGTREKGIKTSQNGTLNLVLSHTPDNIYRLADSNADIVFSGHYHGGQIRVPFAGPIVVPSVYGRRFDRGHFVVNQTHLFVSSGIGAAGLMVRTYCRPDIFVVDILNGSGRGESSTRESC